MLRHCLRLFFQTYFLALDYTPVENSTGMFSHSRGKILNLLYCDIFYFWYFLCIFILTFLKCRFLVKGRIREGYKPVFLDFVFSTETTTYVSKLRYAAHVKHRQLLRTSYTKKSRKYAIDNLFRLIIFEMKIFLIYWIK